MEDKLLYAKIDLNNYNLNFSMDNFQVIVHNFMVDNFENIEGYDTHQHSCYELHYVKEGTGSVFYDNETHPLQSGDVFLMAPYNQHKQFVNSEGMTEYSLRFDIKKLGYFPNNPTACEESDSIMNLLKITSNRIFHEAYDIEEFFERAFHEAYYKQPGFYITVKQSIMEIIIYTARKEFQDVKPYDGYDFPTRSTEASQMELLTQYIRDNIASHLTNTVLAQYVHISERQLHRLIKKQLDLSPHQYVTQLRINYVKHLMHNKTYSLKSISEMAGFSSEFHLSTAFKKYEKVTPSEYIHNLDDSYEEVEEAR